MAVFLLFGFCEESCDQRAADLHCADRTEFLTAKASDAIGATDRRLIVFHHDGLGGADLGAFFASDAAATQSRTRGKHPSCNERKRAAKDALIAGKGKTSANRNVLEVGQAWQGGV